MKFELTEDEAARAINWQQEKLKQVQKEQAEADSNGLAARTGQANLGAIGGAFTYCFTPTSLGTIAKVVFGQSGSAEDQLILTNFEEW